MKTIVAASILAVSSSVFADCRVINGRNADDQGAAYLHLPFSSANTDYEAKLSVSSSMEKVWNRYPLVTVPDGNGGMSSFKYQVEFRTGNDNLPAPLRSGNGTFSVSSGTTGEVCTVFSDGDEYQSDNWSISYRRMPYGLQNGMGAIEATITVFDLAQQ